MCVLGSTHGYESAIARAGAMDDGWWPDFRSNLDDKSDEAVCKQLMVVGWMYVDVSALGTAAAILRTLNLACRRGKRSC